MSEMLLIISLSLILIGIIILIIYLLTKSSKFESAFVLFIGPIPIFGGSEKLVIIALIISLILLIIFLFSIKKIL